MFRTTTITTTAAAALAVASFALPAVAGAAPVDAAAHLEVHAVADSGKALRQVHASARKAKALVARSEAAMKQAYSTTISQGQQSSAQGLQASANFSAAADAQGDKLSAIVEKSKGGLKAAAADALAKTGRMEAAVVARVAKGLEQQQSASSNQQGEGVADVGGDHASLTTTIVVTASGDGLRDALRSQLDKATAVALQAQARLVQAVADLRSRSESQGQSGWAGAQASLQADGSKLAEVVRNSGRADVSFSVDNGSVTMGDLAQRTVDTGDSPATFSASGQAHVATHGGSR